MIKAFLCVMRVSDMLFEGEDRLTEQGKLQHQVWENYVLNNIFPPGQTFLWLTDLYTHIPAIF